MQKNIKESQLRDFLKRAEVHTMRQDLKRLREMEALKERERIIKLKTGEVKEKEQFEGEKKEKWRIFKKVSDGKREKTITEIKQQADESEKQQIFQFEAEKLKLKNKLEELQQKQEPPLLLEKNKLLRKKTGLEKEIGNILKDEKKIEDEQKFISEKEREAKTQKEKQKFEKRRWQLEEGRKKIEVKRWAKEKDIETLGNQIKENEEIYQKVLTTEKGIEEKIQEFDDSLQSIYEKLKTREQKRQQTEEKQKRLESLKRAEEESKRKEEIREREWTKRKQIRKKGFLKKIPGLAKEKLIEKMEKASEKEEKERKKFLERVEGWAKEENKEKKSKK